MRVAHVLPANIPVTTDRGGALERRVLAMADEQARRGMEVAVFSANEPVALERESGASIRPIPVRLSRPACDVEYLVKVRESLRGKRVDIAHSHAQPLSASVLGSRVRAVVGQFDNFYFSGSSNRALRAAYGRALARFTVLTAVSDFTAREMREFYGFSHAIRVLSNGVDLTHFTEGLSVPCQLAERIPHTPNGYVLFCGRVNEQKGADLLPHIAARLAEQGIELVVAGPIGQFGNSSRSGAEILGPDVRYLGVVPDHELPGLMASARALVLPTRRLEMFGMVLVEAGAVGTPAVASALGGIPEAMGAGGILVNVGDVEGFARGLIEICLDTARHDDLAALARANARKFSWSEVVTAADRVYADALALSGTVER